jgi:hypothetical protein
MQIPRLVITTIRTIDLGRHFHQGAVRNAAAAVAADQFNARVREDLRREVERANLSARLMSRPTG